MNQYLPESKESNQIVAASNINNYYYSMMQAPHGIRLVEFHHGRMGDPALFVTRRCILFFSPVKPTRNSGTGLTGSYVRK